MREYLSLCKQGYIYTYFYIISFTTSFFNGTHGGKINVSFLLNSQYNYSKIVFYPSQGFRRKFQIYFDKILYNVQVEQCTG